MLVSEYVCTIRSAIQLYILYLLCCTLLLSFMTSRRYIADVAYEKHILFHLVQALAAALQADIPAMVNGLVELGLDVNVSTEDLLAKDLLC